MSPVGIEFTTWTGDYRPAWAKETPNYNNLVIAGAILDIDAFGADTEGSNDVEVTTTALAAEAAVALAVEALSGAIPAGTMLVFDTGIYALVTVAAAAGATALTVEALPAAVPDASTATYSGVDDADAVVSLPGGSLVMRALADREDGAFIPFSDAYDDATHEAYLTYHGIYDVRDIDEVTLYRPGRVVAYNKLPGWDDLSAEAQAFVHANYQTIHAAE